MQTRTHQAIQLSTKDFFTMKKNRCFLAQLLIILFASLSEIGCGSNSPPKIPDNSPPPPANDPGPAQAGPPVKPIQVN
jgi:hypothetical protein